MEYTTRAIMSAFGISRETVRSWSLEFAPYLSTTARPGQGKHRVFNDDDLAVFAMVASCRRQGMSTEEIHATLRSGQRGELPEVDSVVLAHGEHGRQLAVLTNTIKDLQTERDALAQALQESRDAEQQRVGQVVLLEKQLEQMQQRIMELYQRIARLEASK